MKSLKILLSGLAGFDKPRSSLEQWATPGEIAGTMVSLAKEDLSGKTVLDLGAGTGVLSIAASLIGAKRVVAVEIDRGAVSILEANLNAAGVDNVEIVNSDVSEFRPAERFDTAIMNPPFGADKGNLHADTIFLKKALELSEVCYSLHLAKTRTFISRLSGENSWTDRVIGTFHYPLPARESFHKSRVRTEEVDYHRIWRNKGK